MKKILLILLTIATVGLAVVAVLTSIQLQKIGKKPIAPTARVPSRAAAPVCKLAFAAAGSPTPTPSGSPTPTPTPSGSPTPTPTPTPVGATPTPGPTQVPGLPEAGITWPTWGLLGAGGISVILGILALIL